jgi:hypothetical protein
MRGHRARKMDRGDRLRTGAERGTKETEKREREMEQDFEIDETPQSTSRESMGTFDVRCLRANDEWRKRCGHEECKMHSRRDGR